MNNVLDKILKINRDIFGDNYVFNFINGFCVMCINCTINFAINEYIYNNKCD